MYFIWLQPVTMRRTKRKSTSQYTRDQPTTRRKSQRKDEDVGLQQPGSQLHTEVQHRDADVTPLYSRETPSTSGFGSQTAALIPTYSSAQNEGNNIIDHSLQPRSQLPLISHDIAIDQIPSVHAKLGLNVSETNRTKIKNGEFIELANLLENKSAQRDEKPLIVIDGIIATKEKPKNSITTIEKWTDAFVIYMSIYLSAHPAKCQELLKYLNTVRLGATRIRGLGWKEYDEQFRLKVAADPNKSWDSVDQELWLMFMVNDNSHFYNQNDANFTTHPPNRTSINKCYNYNYKGTCDRTPCIYKHICFRCSGNHPFYLCTVGTSNMHQLSLLNRPFRPRFQSLSQRQIRPNFPGKIQTNLQAQRYMVPRRFSNQN